MVLRLGVLERALEGRKAQLKALLCDQSFIAGIGNIYADEILFCAGISPFKTADMLGFEEIEVLHQCIIGTLDWAIKILSSNMSEENMLPTSNLDIKGLLWVPRSEGAPCVTCETPISKTLIRGRSAYYCTFCQSDSRLGIEF